MVGINIVSLRRVTPLLTLCVLAGLALTIVGCLDGGGGGGGGGGGRGDGDRIDDRPYSVPRRADRVELGVGGLDFTPSEPGTAYVCDASDGQVIVRQSLRKGDRLRVVPGDNLITVNGKRVYDRDLTKRHTHSVYWLSERDDRYSDNRGGDRRDPPDRGDSALPWEIRSARRVAAGRGELSYRATESGKVFVFDRTSREVVFRSDIDRNERLIVSPERGVISLTEAGPRGDRSTYRLNPSHSYEVYIDRR